MNRWLAISVGILALLLVGFLTERLTTLARLRHSQPAEVARTQVIAASTDWDVDKLRGMASAKLRGEFSTDAAAARLRGFRDRFGSIRSATLVTRSDAVFSEHAPGGARSEFYFAFLCQFERGQARVLVALVVEDSQWRLDRFDVPDPPPQ